MNGSDDMNDRPDGQSILQRKKWVGPVLLLSLAANLFLGGILATGAVHKFHPPGPGADAMGIPPHHRIIANSLNEEERREFRRTMRAQFRNLGDDFHAIRDARTALSRAVAADPYDPVTTKAAFADMRRAMDTVADKAQGAMVESFASLSPETRARIAENLAKGRDGAPNAHRSSGHRSGERWSGERGAGERGRGDERPPRDHRMPPHDMGEESAAPE